MADAVLLKVFLKETAAFLTNSARFYTFLDFYGAADFFKMNRAKDMLNLALQWHARCFYDTHQPKNKSSPTKKQII